jgi:hypothetical protein
VQVRDRARLAPERPVVDGSRRVHHDLLVQREPIPAPLGPQSAWRRWPVLTGSGKSADARAGISEADAVQTHQERDRVTARAAPIAVEATMVGVDVQVGTPAVYVERAAADQCPPARTKLDPRPGNHLVDRVIAFEGLHVVA